MATWRRPDAEIQTHEVVDYESESSRELSTIPETSRENNVSADSPQVVKDLTPQNTIKADQTIPKKFNTHSTLHDAPSTKQNPKDHNAMYLTPTKASRPRLSSNDNTSGHRRRTSDREKASPFRPQSSHHRRIQAHLDEATAVLDAIHQEKLQQSHLDLFAETLEAQILEVVENHKLKIEYKNAIHAAASEAGRKTLDEVAMHQLEEFEAELQEIELNHASEIEQLEAALAEKSERIKQLEEGIYVSEKHLEIGSWVVLLCAAFFALQQGWYCVWLIASWSEEDAVHAMMSKLSQTP